MDPPPDITSTSEPQPKKPPQSWDSLCISQDCPIKHPHNFGLRPQTNTSPLIVWTDADALITDDDRGYPDTQPPPLIKAMIDTLRIDPEITMRYPRFTDVLRDFYRAHGGRSHLYHGPEGMFGLGMDLSAEGGYGGFSYHRHPDEEGLGGWFAFEVEGDEENEEI